MHLSSSSKRRRGFTLVEVLASVTIIGIIVFLAIPNIISIRRDTEENMAIARAEAVNMAVSSFIQANGLQRASTLWTGYTGTTAQQDRYHNLISPYMAYPPNSLTDLMPSGYGIALQSSLGDSSKAVITKPGGTTSLDY